MLQVPATYNNLSQIDLALLIPRLPQVAFWVQTANIPGISLRSADQPTMFSRIPVHGLQPSYGNLEATFLLDEDMVNFREIKDWIDQAGMPDGEEYTTYADTACDISLLVLNSNKRANVEVRFEQAIPIQISGNLFTSTATDVEYQTATVVFEYRKYYITKL